MTVGFGNKGGSDVGSRGHPVAAIYLAIQLRSIIFETVSLLAQACRQSFCFGPHDE